MYSPAPAPYGGHHGAMPGASALGMLPSRSTPTYPGGAGLASPVPGTSGYYPGMYEQASQAPPASPYASMPPGRQELAMGEMSGQSPQRWQDAYMDMEQEKRQLQGELRSKGEDMSGLAREAQSLREQIRAEQERRQAKISEYSQQLEGLEHDNKQLQVKLMKVQMQDSAKLTDVTTVKKEVVAKTMELEKMMREFQSTHQERLYSRVWNVTSAMLAVCQKQEVVGQGQIQTESRPAATSESLTLQAPLNLHAAPVISAATAPSNTIATAGEEAITAGATVLDPETQQLLKKRLQSLGDVVVHASDKFEACCASGRVIPPGTLRVRPRRCDHVFLVECLMPYWAEGLCPVCRCSFAFDRPQDAGYDESDRYSSVSTSISQAVPRHMQSSSNSDGGSLRGPRSLHTIGEANKERGRSSSAARQKRRGRGTSTSQGRSGELGIPASPAMRNMGHSGSELGLAAVSPDMRGDLLSGSQLGARPSPALLSGGLGANNGGRPAPGSPPRSVVSRASSVPRDRLGPPGQAMQQGSRPL